MENSQMPVQATCLIMCPSCKALFRSQRTTCYQCGERLIDPKPEQTITSGRSWGDNNKFMQDEIRRTRRVPVSMEATTISGDGVIGEPVTIEDVGKGGLQFRSACEYTVGTRVRLLVTVEGQQLMASGIVRRIGRTLGEQRTYESGIEFLHTDQGLLEHISKLGQG